MTGVSWLALRRAGWEGQRGREQPCRRAHFTWLRRARRARRQTSAGSVAGTSPNTRLVCAVPTAERRPAPQGTRARTRAPESTPGGVPCQDVSQNRRGGLAAGEAARRPRCGVMAAPPPAAWAAGRRLRCRAGHASCCGTRSRPTDGHRDGHGGRVGSGAQSGASTSQPANSWWRCRRAHAPAQQRDSPVCAQPQPAARMRRAGRPRQPGGPGARASRQPLSIHQQQQRQRTGPPQPLRLSRQRAKREGQRSPSRAGTCRPRWSLPDPGHLTRNTWHRPGALRGCHGCGARPAAPRPAAPRPAARGCDAAWPPGKPYAS